MPPKKNKNKPSRNGFMQYMLDVRSKQPNKFANMQELQDYAGQRWKNFTAEQKKPFEEMALLSKNNASRVKYTSDRVPIEEVEAETRANDEKVSDMKETIRAILQDAKVDGYLEEEVFMILHINKLVYHPPQDQFYACEIGIAAFTLKDGVNPDSVFHRIIRPGKLPLGYYATAKIFSENSHKLLAETQQEPYEDNTEDVFNDMIAFMLKYKANQLPILFADEKYIKDYENILDNWCRDFNFQERLQVFNLQYMFYMLRNIVSDESIPVWPSDTFSRSEIEKDVYCYNANIACEYHEGIEVTENCSKSIVTRYAFVICDNCCSDLNITLLPGFHIPVGSKITNPALATRSSSMASNLNSDSGFTRVYHKKPSSISGGVDSNWASLGATSTSSISSGYKPNKASSSSVQERGDSRRSNPQSIGRSFNSLSIEDDSDGETTVINLPPRRPINALPGAKRN